MYLFDLYVTGHYTDHLLTLLCSSYCKDHPLTLRFNTAHAYAACECMYLTPPYATMT